MSFERFIASIQAPALVEIADHWNAARRGRRLPAWRDIDPAAIRNHLPLVWAWRYDPAQRTLIGRLGGETVTNVLGIQIRGKRLEDCFPSDSIDAIRERLEPVRAGPKLCLTTSRVYVTSGRHGTGERISMPLSAATEFSELRCTRSI